jgi:hypothetical protein
MKRASPKNSLQWRTSPGDQVSLSGLRDDDAGPASDSCQHHQPLRERPGGRTKRRISSARHFTAHCDQQPATRSQKRGGHVWLAFLVEKIAPECPRTRPRLLAAVLVAYPCGRFQRQLFSFRPGHTLGSHLGNHPGRARRNNLASGPPVVVRQ